MGCKDVVIVLVVCKGIFFIIVIWVLLFVNVKNVFILLCSVSVLFNVFFVGWIYIDMLINLFEKSLYFIICFVKVNCFVFCFIFCMLVGK